MTRLLWIVTLVFTALLALPASAQEATQAPEPTIASQIEAAATSAEPEFTILYAALQAAGPALLEALSDPTVQLTLFAPTDAAFAAQIERWGEEDFQALMENPQALTFILTFHLVSGVYPAAGIAANITQADAAGRSAWVNTINGQYADLVLDGGTVYIDGAALDPAAADITASNGLIHTIDAVMLPEPRTIGQLLTDPQTAARYELNTLSAAILAADSSVLDTLNEKDSGGFTLFAPTDAAFAVLGEDALEAALTDPDALRSLLAYHLLSGVARSGDLASLLAANQNAFTVPTVEGNDLVISLTPDGAFINDAKLMISDIDAVNGVIHIIDAVLVPPFSQ
ncbi:MAG: fasciclin domain-containing protein [Anaerolineae bacterium]|nr:fasciclin domain-containing protein [Anaerolineae bacterium]